MDVALDIATAVRAAVLPHLGRPETRGTEGTSVGGDPTFGIDVIAERAAERVLESAGEDLAWYTEDRGLVVRGKPKRLFVVDPIDGTRPAGAGLEAACVSVAEAPFDENATLGDVSDGVVFEIKSGTLFRAKRGKGARIIARGETRPPTPSNRTKVAGSFWVYGLRGRPAIPSTIVLEELIDASGVSGGTFDLGSATYAMTGVVAGRFDAYVDHGQRLIDDIPATRPMFQRIADGAVLNNNPYDIAAALLICREAGCPATDAGGGDLDARPLVGSGAGYTLSTLVACTRELHAELLQALDRGIDRLRAQIEG
ncbi:MAG TPA: inositol monophosphatase family protein [Actinomycetota bacterium]|jgi:myo-inositol-1(or 4)-monophosphatase|nr:inositol monophosphatase family protein [Actinomycetota bacterium]